MENLNLDDEDRRKVIVVGGELLDRQGSVTEAILEAMKMSISHGPIMIADETHIHDKNKSYEEEASEKLSKKLSEIVKEDTNKVLTLTRTEGTTLLTNPTDGRTNRRNRRRSERKRNK